MKLLVLSDMHGERAAVRKAKELVLKNRYDAIVYLGDFSQKIGDAERNIADAEHFISELEPLTKVYALFGNCDVREVEKLLEGRGVLLHNKVIMMGGTAIVGWGGSHPTPFNTPSEFKEDEIGESVERLLSDAKKKGAKRIILLTHEPPKGTNADLIHVGHVGSEALRKIIEKHQPEIHACGHIHEAKSEDLVGKTKVINVGQAKHGHFLEVIIEDEITARGISL